MLFKPLNKNHSKSLKVSVDNKIYMHFASTHIQEYLDLHEWKC